MLHARIALLGILATAAAAHPTARAHTACGQTHPFPASGADSHASRITVTYQDADIKDVVAAFATYSARKIVVGKRVDGTVTIDLHDQPWDLALQSILTSRNLLVCEDEQGTIRVGDCNPFASDARSTLPKVSVTYQDADLRQVVFAFAKFSGRTIVVAPGVSEVVTTDIHDQAWDVALQSILGSRNLTASEDDHGVITVDRCAENAG
jgi:type II secretory pathway component HofQ